MKTAIEGLYKGIREIKAGSFYNSKGDLINYNNSYKIIFDQYINNIPKETQLKINKELALNILPTFKPYDKIVINLDLTFYDNKNVIIKIISVEKK